MKFQEWFYCKPHTCMLTAYWEGSPSKHSPWTAMHLSQRCCHCWKHFWNSCCGTAFSAVVTFFGCLQYLEMSVALGRLYFWKQPEVIRNKITRTGWVFRFRNVFLGHKLTESASWAGALSWRRTHRWAKVQAHFYAQLHVTSSIFPYSKLSQLNGLVKWIQSEQKMMNTIFIYDSDTRAFLGREDVICFH
jgi:hypothetical protein